MSLQEACSRVYGLLSRAFLYPAEGLALEMPAFPGALREALTEAGAAELADQVPEAPPTDSLEADYREIFGGGQAVACPPYETEYTGSHVWMQTQQMADIAGFYRAFGVDTQETGEKVDFIATELEFLYLLCVKEAVAESEGNTEAAEICRDARQKFLKEHLSVWLPRLNQRMQQQEAVGFYPALVNLTDRFAAVDAGRCSHAGA